MFSIALIGIGPMAANHAQALATIPELKIVSCASRSLERAQRFAGEHGIPRARLIDDVLARPEADAVWVVAPAVAMAQTALHLNPFGIPLFLEKPVGLDLEESTAVRDALTVPHMVGLNRRFYEVIGLGRRMIEQAGGLRAMEIHMPEDVYSLPDETYPARLKRQWQFANSVHMIDLFRVMGGEAAAVHRFNDVRDAADRGFISVVDFQRGGRGVFNAQWYAPGRWRMALYADGLSLVYQPVEQVIVMRRGEAMQTIGPAGPDGTLKAGLHGQALAFLHLLSTGTLHPEAADMTEYLRSCTLVDQITTLQS